MLQEVLGARIAFMRCPECGADIDVKLMKHEALRFGVEQPATAPAPLKTEPDNLTPSPAEDE